MYMKWTKLVKPIPILTFSTRSNLDMTSVHMVVVHITSRKVKQKRTKNGWPIQLQTTLPPLHVLTQVSKTSPHHAASVYFPHHTKSADEEYQYAGSVPSQNRPYCFTLHIDLKYARNDHSIGWTILQVYYSTPEKNRSCTERKMITVRKQMHRNISTIVSTQWPLRSQITFLYNASRTVLG